METGRTFCLASFLTRQNGGKCKTELRVAVVLMGKTSSVSFPRRLGVPRIILDEKFNMFINLEKNILEYASCRNLIFNKTK